MYIFCGPGLASHRRCRLTSNVRPHTNPSAPSRRFGNSVQCTRTSAATVHVNSKSWAAPSRFGRRTTGRMRYSRQSSVAGQALRPRPDGRQEQPRQSCTLLSLCASTTPRSDPMTIRLVVLDLSRAAVAIEAAVAMAASPAARSLEPVWPNPSFKPSPNGGPPGPGHRYGVHCLWPGPGVPPSVPA